MSIKSKNDDKPLLTYEQSLSAQLQQWLGWGKTVQIALNASPQECLLWMDSVTRSMPEGHEAVVESQAIKRPYQFGAQLFKISRRMGVGIVMGDVIANSLDENQSVVTLRLYQMGERLSSVSLALGFCVIMTLLMISGAFRLGMRGMNLSVLGLIGVGVWFAVLGCVGALTVWKARYRALDIVTEHLLKLNTQQKEASPNEVAI